MNIKPFLICASLLIVSEMAYSETAHALRLTLSAGGSRPSDNATDQGSFVDSFTPAETITFSESGFAGNLGGGYTNTVTLGSGASVTFSTPAGATTTNTQNPVNQTSIRNESGGSAGSTNFAPTGPGNAQNNSNYLAVFSGIPVNLTFDNNVPSNPSPIKNAITLFGVNFGFIDASNLIQVTTTTNGSTFITSTIGFNNGGNSNVTPVSASSSTVTIVGTAANFDLATLINPRTTFNVASQDSTYITITANQAAGEYITAVTLLQANTVGIGQTQGLETDNYAFTFFPNYAQPVPFEFSPQIGILSMGALFALKKKFFKSKKD